MASDLLAAARSEINSSVFHSVAMLWGKCGDNSLGSSCRILWHFDWLKHMGDWQPRTEEASTATALQLAMWLQCYSTATGHVTALLQHCNLPCDRIATALQLAMWPQCYSTATGHVTALLQHCAITSDCTVHATTANHSLKEVHG